MVFFVLLSFDHHVYLRDIGLWVFVVACATDYLDGYLARKYDLVTGFGRVADPFVDKIIVCGGFALLAGRSTVIVPWMVVVLISREFLVSSIRGYAESRGIEFGAALSGKIKAVVQMVAVGFVIHFEAHENLPFLPAALSKWLTLGTGYLALLLTVVSAVPYVTKAMRAFGAASDTSPQDGARE